MPSSVGAGTAQGTIFAASTSEPASRVFDGQTLFTDSGNDAFTCDGGPGAGPDFYVETKKYDGKDPQRLKLWKMFLLHWLLTSSNGNDTLNLDTVPGLNTVGATATTSFPVVSSFTDKRIKFMKRSQFLSLRLWQSSSSITRVTLGPWALALKYKRPGRV